MTPTPAPPGPGQRLLGHLAAVAYRLGALVHWPARERAIDAVLPDLRAGDRPARLVDVGSGHGPLAALAAARGHPYLGLEPDPYLRLQAERRYGRPGCRFAAATAGEAAALIEPTDVVVVNGVAHHLPDEELLTLARAAGACQGLLIVDHWYRPGRVSWLNRSLQLLDRGRWVRDYTFFERLDGLDLTLARVFPVPPWPTLWLFFLNLYRPRGGA